MAKLTEEQVRELVASLKEEQHFKDRNTKWGEDRELVFGDRPVIFPGVEMETEYRTPELLEAADKYTARFLGAPFSISLAAQGEGIKAFQKAQHMENYDYRVSTKWWTSGSFTGPIHDMAGVTGEGWLHLTLNRAVLPVIPQKENYNNDEQYLKDAKAVLDEFTKGERTDLFVVEPVREPETIYYTPDRSCIFMRAEVPAPALMRQYGREGAGGYYGEKGKSKGIEGQKGVFTVTTIDGAIHPEGFNTGIYSSTIMLYIVEDEEYIYHVIEDAAETNSKKTMQAIGCYKNVFGAPGFVCIKGRETNHPDTRHRVHPLTHGAIAITPNLNIASTIVLSGGIYGEMTRIQLEPASGPEAALERANAKTLEIELLGNRVIKPPDGWVFTQPNIGVNADTLNALAQLEAKMLKYSYPLELGDPGETDASSGYQQAIQRDTVSSHLDPPLANIATALGRLLDLKDTGIKTVGLPVTFRNANPTDEVGRVSRSVMAEITIDPEDIVEVDRVVRFDSLTQYARQAKIELGDSLLEKGRISKEMFYADYMGIDDPARLERKIFIEAAQQIGREIGLKTAQALAMQVQATVAQEALTVSGMEPFLALEAGTQATPMGPTPNGAPADANAAITTGNGAGGSVPLQPAPPAETELGNYSEGSQFG